MFGRQNIGASNPFQQFGTVNPIQQASLALSARCPVCGVPSAVSSLYQQQPLGINPLTAASPFGGVNPLAFVNPQGFQGGGFSANPFASVQTPTLGGINPYITPQLGGTELQGQFGLGQFNPLTQHYLGAGQLGGQQGGPLGAVGAGQWGGASISGLGSQGQQQPWGGVNPHILAQVLANPSIANDPVVGALVSQQLNPLAFQQPPIRSLIGPQQQNPLQFGAAGGFGQTTGQGIDPYTALVQAQLMSQLAINPYQQMLRAFAGSPGAIGGGFSPFSAQVPPFAQTGVPFGI